MEWIIHSILVREYGTDLREGVPVALVVAVSMTQYPITEETVYSLTFKGINACMA